MAHYLVKKFLNVFKGNRMKGMRITSPDYSTKLVEEIRKSSLSKNFKLLIDSF